MATKATKATVASPKPRNGMRAAVVRYLEQHPGQTIWVQDMAEALLASELQVQSAINNLRAAKPDYPLETHVRGKAWIYRPNHKSDNKRAFEELAITKTGEIVIQDENGKVYLAREM